MSDDRIAEIRGRCGGKPRCGCGGEYTGHDSCRARADIDHLLAALDAEREKVKEAEHAYDLAVSYLARAEAADAALARVQALPRYVEDDVVRRPSTEEWISAEQLEEALAVSRPPEPPQEGTVIDKRKVGLYRKFDVRRTDGSDGAGGKHEGCNYYVLDLTHDPHAIPALRAYADSCRSDYPLLARDLDALADGNPLMPARTELAAPRREE